MPIRCKPKRSKRPMITEDALKIVTRRKERSVKEKLMVHIQLNNRLYPPYTVRDNNFLIDLHPK